MNHKLYTLLVLAAIILVDWNLSHSRRTQSPEISTLVLTQEIQTPVVFKGRGENRLYASGTISDLINDLVSPPMNMSARDRKENSVLGATLRQPMVNLTSL